MNAPLPPVSSSERSAAGPAGRGTVVTVLVLLGVMLVVVVMVVLVVVLAAGASVVAVVEGAVEGAVEVLPDEHAARTIASKIVSEMPRVVDRGRCIG